MRGARECSDGASWRGRWLVGGNIIEGVSRASEQTNADGLRKGRENLNLVLGGGVPRPQRALASPQPIPCREQLRQGRDLSAGRRDEVLSGERTYGSRARAWAAVAAGVPLVLEGRAPVTVLSFRLPLRLLRRFGDLFDIGLPNLVIVFHKLTIYQKVNNPAHAPPQRLFYFVST